VINGNCAIVAIAYRELLLLHYGVLKTLIWFADNRLISILPLSKLLS
jgi:hypothetical protein